MNRAALVVGAGALGIGVFALRKLCERQHRNAYLTARSCVIDLQGLVANCVLRDDQPNFEVTTDSEDLIVNGLRSPSEHRDGWFEYNVSVLLEDGVKAGSLHGSLIVLTDADGNYLGEMSLIADETWSLHGFIALPDPEVHFSLRRGIADGNVVFSCHE